MEYLISCLKAEGKTAWTEGKREESVVSVGAADVEPAARRRLKSDTCRTSFGRREGGEGKSEEREEYAGFKLT